jgi:hypothetical protein
MVLLLESFTKFGGQVYYTTKLTELKGFFEKNYFFLRNFQKTLRQDISIFFTGYASDQLLKPAASPI